MGALFNSKSNKAYSYSPFQNPFDAHFVDVAAGAKPEEIGTNTVNEAFTYTVFVEEATAEYCPYCPAMAEALNDIYESENYPFYFVTLITKNKNGGVINQVALDYLVEVYNLAAYPSAYFDSGYKVLVGGYDDESYYRNRIEQSGSRDVHELDFSLSVEWIADGEIQMDISITNNEEGENLAPNTPTIQGPTSGQVRKSYEYTFSTIDPDGDDIYYYVEFCEGCDDSQWHGPYPSGEELTLEHTWTESDMFTVKVKDINDLESDWATLDVTIPIGRINLNNNAPNPPSISGPTSGKIDTTYDYEVTVTDPDEDDGLLILELDFGDGIIAEDCGCSRVWQNGEVIDMSHRWKKLVHIQFQEE